MLISMGKNKWSNHSRHRWSSCPGPRSALIIPALAANLATDGTAQRTVGAASQQMQPLPGVRATAYPLARIGYVRDLPADAQLGWDGPLHHHADSPVAAQDAHERGPGAPDVAADAVHHAVRLDRVQHLVHGDQVGQVVQRHVFVSTRRFQEPKIN